MKLKIFGTALFALAALFIMQPNLALAQSSVAPDLSGNDPNWIQATNSNCWGYGPYDGRTGNGTLTWEGQCSLSLLTGKGAATWTYPTQQGLPDTVTVTGSFSRGKPEGSITKTERGYDGTIYVFQYYIDDSGNETPEGSGSITQPDGTILAGHWVAGQISPSIEQFSQNGSGNWWSLIADDTNTTSNQSNSSSPSVSSQDQQSSDNAPTTQDYVNALQNTLGQTAQNVNGQLSQMQTVHNQVQQELAMRNAQALAARNQPETPAPVYIPPPPPAVSILDKQVASNTPVTGTPADQCVANFYNSSMYNWFYWKDTCSFPITIAAELRNGTSTEGGVSTVYPGNNGNSSTGGTGLGANEVNQGGGFVYAACPQGYIPTDTSTNQIYGKNSSSFYCKQGYVP